MVHNNSSRNIGKKPTTDENPKIIIFALLRNCDIYISVADPIPFLTDPDVFDRPNSDPDSGDKKIPGPTESGSYIDIYAF